MTKILIFEDDASLQLMFKCQFQNLNVDAELIQISDAEEGLRLLSNQTIDLVMIDASFVNQMEVVRKVAARCSAPVLAMSPREHLRQKMVEAGAVFEAVTAQALDRACMILGLRPRLAWAAG